MVSAPRGGSGGSSRVVPAGPKVVEKAKRASTRRSAIERAWDHAQVSYRGAYSVERLYAFEEYCSHASLFRVLLVCVLAPLPPLVLALVIETVPLQSPSLGWQVNYVFFVRSTLCAFVISTAFMLQIKNIFPDLELTPCDCVQVSTCVSATTTAGVLVLASCWTFPVPLTMTLGTVPFLLVFVIVSVRLIGVKRICQLTDARNRLRRFAALVAIQASLPLIYPAFTALYSQITTPSAQLVCICVLPLIKQLLKSLLVRHAIVTVHDYVPEIVVFSIDAFHSIYLCACMQVTGSPWTKGIIFALDIAHHGLSFAGIYRRTSVVRALYALRAPIFHKRSLISIAVDLFAHPNCLDARAFASVRLRSCLHHRISRQASRVIRRLSITHPSQMPKEEDDTALVEIKATPTSLIPIPLLLSRQSTEDLLVLADVNKTRAAGRYRRTNSFKILRIQLRRGSRSTSSTRSTERSRSSISSGPTVPSTVATEPPKATGKPQLNAPAKMLPRSGTSASNAFAPSSQGASLADAAKRHRRLHVFDSLPATTKSELAHESLSLLFTTEYLSLTEYIELVVPIVYTVYVPLLGQLDNFQFHTLLNAKLGSHEALARATLNIAIYAVLEILTFAGFHFAMKKWMRVSPLYQVAFVLENQIEMIEGKLLAWVLYAVQFPLAHCGGLGVYGG